LLNETGVAITASLLGFIFLSAHLAHRFEQVDQQGSSIFDSDGLRQKYFMLQLGSLHLRTSERVDTVHSTENHQTQQLFFGSSTVARLK
jgi:hypothetical protein